jgi:hypothetical protein
MHDVAASSNRNHTRGRQRARARHAACCTQSASGSAVCRDDLDAGTRRGRGATPGAAPGGGAVLVRC